MSKKATFFLVLFFHFYLKITAQSFADFVKENAIFLPKLDEKNEVLAKKMLDYQCIMIGEMHGTQEPASFTIGILKSLSQKKKIVLGIEIPTLRKQQMKPTIF
jgi:uncharacterized iron-regulated protein